MTQLNGLEYTEIGANNTVWMFVLLIFYNALLLVYFGATSKIGSRNFEKLSVIAGIPLSLILYAVLPWYLQASAGSGFSYGSVRMVLKFAETTLAVVFPVAVLLLSRPFERSVRWKDAALLGYFVPFGAMMLPHGIFSALLRDGEGNLRAGSLYQLVWVLATIALFILLYVVLSRKDQKTKYSALLLISLSVVIQYFKIYTFRDIELWNLPIHICNMGTIFIFISLFFRWCTLEMFTYYINVFGATMAMAVPLINDGFWQFSTFNYMYEHSMLIVLPIMSVLLGVSARPKRSEIPKILPLFFGYYLLSVIVGSILHIYDANVNYFYVIKDTIAQYLPFLMPLRSITFHIGRAVFYPFYWVVIFVGIIGIVYVLDFIYNYIYIFEDRRIEMRAILAQEKELKTAAVSEQPLPEGNALLEVRGLQKTYTSTGNMVIRGIDLRLEAGEIVWLIGANGARKSTAIKCIVGILRPDSGEICFDGKNVQQDLSGFKAKTGYVPDLSNAYERISGIHYLERVASVYGISDAEERKERIYEISKKLAFEKYLPHPIKTYSHGTKQKLNFIAGVLHRPRLLILDEPMTGLDPGSTIALIDRIKEYAAERNSVFFSSHLLNVVENVCDTVGILKNGNLTGQYRVKGLNSGVKELYREFNR